MTDDAKTCFPWLLSSYYLSIRLLALFLGLLLRLDSFRAETVPGQRTEWDRRCGKAKGAAVVGPVTVSSPVSGRRAQNTGEMSVVYSVASVRKSSPVLHLQLSPSCIP